MALLRRDIGKFLSTSPLRGTTRAAGPGPAALFISIHVPLAGDDGWIRYSDSRRFCISIHVPLAGDDQGRPARRPAFWDFYPRPPCGGRLNRLPGQRRNEHFYPRPPCGGRLGDLDGRASVSGFLSTSPLRGTTARRFRCFRQSRISIHVPLAGDDAVPAPHRLRRTADFYPRPPCGGRRGSATFLPVWHGNFYPRPPCGGRPGSKSKNTAPRKISIHVPLAGDDAAALLAWAVERYFYPRPPCGGRPQRTFVRPGEMQFLSTSPLRGTTFTKYRYNIDTVFLSTSPLRGTTDE